MPALAHASLPARRLALMPEDVDSLVVDFDPSAPNTVWSDVAATTPAVVGGAVAAIQCRLTGWLLTQPNAAQRFNLEAQGDGFMLGINDTGVTRHLLTAFTPQSIVDRINQVPLTFGWWIRPDSEPAAGNPNYHWELYNSADTAIHVNAQYNDPNDASGHKRFTVARRRSDTTGSTSIAVRVDDAIYPTASVGAWAFLCFVFEAGGLDTVLHLYLNGQRIGTATSAASFSSALTTAAAFYLGCRNVTGNYAHARFRRWCLWNRALQAGEMRRLWDTTREAWSLT